MARDADRRSKKTWATPEVRKLNLTDREIAELFPEYAASLRPNRHARA